MRRSRETLCIGLLAGCAWTQVASAAPPAGDPDEVRAAPRETSRVRGEVAPNTDSARGDGVYGRLDGDLSFSLGLGAEFARERRGTALGRVLYFHTVGLFAAYSDAFDDSARLRRSASLGVELRPLFLLRWSQDMQFNRATYDLALDSLALGVAGVWSKVGGERPRSQSNVEWSLGMGVPLCANARGLWVEAKGFVQPGNDSHWGGTLLLSYYAPVISPWLK